MLGAIVVFIAGGFFIFQYQNIFSGKTLPVVASTNTNQASTVVAVVSEPPTPTPVPPPQKLANPPEIIKAVYVTGYSAGSKKYLDYLSTLFKNTEINAVVVNIKEDDGRVSYKSGVEDVKKYGLYNGAIKDIDALVRFFHDKNIYVIGRIVVFDDPIYSKIKPDLAIFNKPTPTPTPTPTAAVIPAETIIENPSPVPITSPEPTLWKDNKGITWLDPTAKGVWDYNISLAKDAFYHGFDEINFDYIRFPSDGKTQNMSFHSWDAKTTKAGVIKSFFEYLRQELAGDPPPPGSPASAWRGKISVDLFGQTTTNKDDMGIGQLIENAFENFDYISPMVYPSHYINGFMGFDNPADHPYEIIKYSMATALSRENIFLKKIEEAINKPDQPTDSSSDLQTAILMPTPTLTPTPTPLLSSSIILAKFRPWLQDFNMGAVYNIDMVKSEIQATKDALGENYNGFMLWNPSNIYTQGAILKPIINP